MRTISHATPKREGRSKPSSRRTAPELHEDEIAVTGVAHDIPVLPTGPTGMRNMPGLMAGLPRDGDQVDAETFVDQKSHDAEMSASR